MYAEVRCGVLVEYSSAIVVHSILTGLPESTRHQHPSVSPLCGTVQHGRHPSVAPRYTLHVTLLECPWSSLEGIDSIHLQACDVARAVEAHLHQGALEPQQVGERR